MMPMATFSPPEPVWAGMFYPQRSAVASPGGATGCGGEDRKRPKGPYRRGAQAGISAKSAFL